MGKVGWRKTGNEAGVEEARAGFFSVLVLQKQDPFHFQDDRSASCARRLWSVGSRVLYFKRERQVITTAMLNRVYTTIFRTASR